jgi:hypothetical protein
MIRQTHPAEKKWLDRVFEPIADAVGEFVRRHAMRFEKCPFGRKDWVLAGGHPRGGNIILFLRYSVIRGLCITGIWQVGCPELSVFHTHARKMRRARIDPTEVTTILEEELAALLATEYGNWTVTRPIPNIGKFGPTV